MQRVPILSTVIDDVEASNGDLLVFNDDQIVSAATRTGNATTISVETLTSPGTLAFPGALTVTQLGPVDSITMPDITATATASTDVTAQTTNLTDAVANSLVTTTLTSLDPTTITFTGNLTNNNITTFSSATTTTTTVTTLETTSATYSGPVEFQQDSLFHNMRISPSATVATNRLLRYEAYLNSGFVVADSTWICATLSSPVGTYTGFSMTGRGTISIDSVPPDGFVDIIVTIFWVTSTSNSYLGTTGTYYIACVETPANGDLTNFRLNDYEPVMSHIDAATEFETPVLWGANYIGTYVRSYGSSCLRKRIPTSYLVAGDEIQVWLRQETGSSLTIQKQSYINIIFSPF